VRGQRLYNLAALAIPALLAFAWRWWAFGRPGVVSLTAEITAAHHDRGFVVPRAALGLLQALGQFVWPRGLAPEYPDLPATALVTALGWGALALLVALTALAWAGRRRAPVLALGITWAVVAYLPHLGLVPLTNLRADRYLYLPALGLTLAAAALLQALATRLAPPAEGRTSPAAWALATGLIVACGARSVRQARVWRDDLTLFTAAAASDPGSQRALVGLSAARLRAGQSLAALEAADAALALGEAARAREMRGIVLMTQGDAAGATRELQAALGEASPTHRPQVLYNLGLARARAGDQAAARAHLREALQLGFTKAARELDRLSGK
jgi:tetratricopeptide (TPR) repeat protein